MASHPLQRPRRIDQLGDLRVRLVGLPQLRPLLQRLLDGHHPEGRRHVRHQPRHPVHIGVGHPQGAADVADGRLRPQRPEGDDLGHPVVAVPLRRVADHLVPPVLGEVQVHVRHLPPLHVQEPLEHQPVLQRVDLRHPQAVEDHRRCRRPAHRHEDAPAAGVLGEVVHHQDVVAEARLAHHLQLVLQPPPRLL